MKLMCKSKSTAGFSLIELIAVVLIMGLLVGGVAIGVNRQIRKAKVQSAKTQIATLSQAISIFEMECGFLPSSLDDLIQEPSGGRRCKGYPAEGFLEKKEIPEDPWGLAFNYAKPGRFNTSGFDLWSNGQDGEEGTSDDIANWASNTEE